MLVLYHVPDHLVDYHLSTIIIIRLIGFITKGREKDVGKVSEIVEEIVDDVVSVIKNRTVMMSIKFIVGRIK